MKKNYLLLVVAFLGLSACESGERGVQNEVQAKETVVLFNAENASRDPERGLGGLADARSTDSVADTSEQDRLEDLLPNQVYSSLKGREGATIATF